MKKTIIITVFAIVILALAGAGFYIYNIFNSFEQGVSDSYEPTERDRSELRDVDSDPSLETFTVLILGIDESESRTENFDYDNEDFRTDTMILATFNQDEDEVKMVSIPRDTLAYFPEENYFDKVTHAHTINGAESSMNTVESLLNVPVDYYARVNMQGLVDVVDTLGGVEFDVPFDTEEPDSNDQGTIELEEGEQELDGEEALAAVRSRSVDTDLGRGSRQLEMIEAIMDKAKSTGALTQIDDLIDVVAENSSHDMDNETIRDLASYYAFNTVEFNNVQIQGSDYWNPENGAYFYMADQEHLYVLSKTLRDTLGLESPEADDLINIRLDDYIVPYEPLEHELLENYEPEYLPEFADEDYESQYGDGFDVPDFDYEDSDIEGEDEMEEVYDGPPENEREEFEQENIEEFDNDEFNMDNQE